MKWTVTIFNLYFLALAVFPCADEAIWCISDVEKTTGVELQNAEGHSHDNECTDYCSPLCTCSCCQMTVRTPIKINFQISALTPTFSDPSSLESLLKDLTSLNEIWQPPKLS